MSDEPKRRKRFSLIPDQPVGQSEQPASMKPKLNISLFPDGSVVLPDCDQLKADIHAGGQQFFLQQVQSNLRTAQDEQQNPKLRVDHAQQVIFYLQDGLVSFDDLGVTKDEFDAQYLELLSAVAKHYAKSHPAYTKNYQEQADKFREKGGVQIPA